MNLEAVASEGKFISRARDQLLVLQAVLKRRTSRDMTHFAYPKERAFVLEKRRVNRILPSIETAMMRV